MAYHIDIVAKDNATPVINAALRKTERESHRVSASMRDKFKDAGIQIAQRFSGSASSIIGSLGHIKSPMAAVGIAALATAGALVAMAKKAAEANKGSSDESRS